MPSGGARAHPGPPPDATALRRGKDGATDWTHLPAEGRQGETPAWPLTKGSTRELLLWGQEWQRPQAVAWEANRQEIEVALLVRCLARAERPNSPIGLVTEVRRLQEALGLSLPGLARNHWIIDLPAGAQPVAIAAGTDGGRSARDRLKVVSRG